MKKLLIALLATAPLFAMANTYDLILDNLSTKELTVKLTEKSSLSTNFTEDTILANSSKTLELNDSGTNTTRDATFTISAIDTPPTSIKFIRKPVGGDTAYTSIKEMPSGSHKIFIEEASCFSSETPILLSYKDCKYKRSLRTHSSIPVTATVKLNIQ